MQHTCNFQNFAVGTDIETINRFDRYANSIELSKKLGIFTDKELEYCFSHRLPAKHLAVRFCAKEAVYKAFCSLNIETLPKFNEIEVLNNEKGVPYVSFTNETFSQFTCKISLSHCIDKAIAYVFLCH